MSQKFLIQDKYKNKNLLGKKDLQRIETGEPLDYIIGWVPFLNCKIDLSRKTLIPRVETEYWTEKVIEEMKLKKMKKIKVLDIFSGSGCVGVAVLKEIKNAKVDFSDVSQSAIKQIKKNLKINGIKSDRYNVYQSDLFSDMPKKKYDFILANPPYLALNRKKLVAQSVVKFEPYVALFGGRDGLFFVRNFLNEAANYLNAGGEIWMEFDSFQKQAIDKMLKKLKYKSWRFEKDQYNRWRFVIICL